MQKIIHTLVAGIQWLSGILFLTLFLLNTLQITLRYFWGISWLWVPDLSRLLFIWMVFLGTSVLYARHEHLVMDFFVNKMKDTHRKKLNLLMDLVLGGFLAILILKGIEITKVRMRIPFDTWNLPSGYAYIAVPVCSALMLFITLVRFIRYFRERRKP